MEQLVVWGRGLSDGYPDGSARGMSNCHACERCFQVNYKHEVNRSECVQSFRNKRKHEHLESALRLQTARSGWRCRKGGGISLLRLGILFYTEETYRRLFGSPSKKENKARKHRKVNYQGVDGYVVPHESDPEEPSAYVERERYVDVNSKEELHTFTDNEDADSDAADRKYDDAVKEMDDDYAEACTGMSIKAFFGKHRERRG